MQPIFYNPVPIRYTVISMSHLRSVRSSVLFPSALPTKRLHAFSISPSRAKSATHLTILYWWKIEMTQVLRHEFFSILLWLVPLRFKNYSQHPIFKNILCSYLGLKTKFHTQTENLKLQCCIIVLTRGQVASSVKKLAYGMEDIGFELRQSCNRLSLLYRVETGSGVDLVNGSIRVLSCE